MTEREDGLQYFDRMTTGVSDLDQLIIHFLVLKDSQQQYALGQYGALHAAIIRLFTKINTSGRRGIHVISFRQGWHIRSTGNVEQKGYDPLHVYSREQVYQFDGRKLKNILTLLYLRNQRVRYDFEG